MRYSEAKKILEKNGMELDMELGESYAYILCNNNKIATVLKRRCYISDNDYDYDYIDKRKLAIAQKVAYKLSRTKPEDREDAPKKYYLKIFNRHDGDGYLNLHKCDNHFTLNNNNDTSIFKTQFTDAEVKQMQKDPVFANADLKKCKEPVEDK